MGTGLGGRSRCRPHRSGRILLPGYNNTIENYRESSKMLSQELAGAIFEGDLPEVGPALFEALFQPALKIAEERDIPLYCGEYDKKADETTDLQRGHFFDIFFNTSWIAFWLSDCKMRF